MRGHELRRGVNAKPHKTKGIKQGYLYVGTNLSVTPRPHKFEWRMCWYYW